MAIRRRAASGSTGSRSLDTTLARQEPEPGRRSVAATRTRTQRPQQQAQAPRRQATQSRTEQRRTQAAPTVQRRTASAPRVGASRTTAQAPAPSGPVLHSGEKRMSVEEFKRRRDRNGALLKKRDGIIVRLRARLKAQGRLPGKDASPRLETLPSAGTGPNSGRLRRQQTALRNKSTIIQYLRGLLGEGDEPPRPDDPGTDAAHLDEPDPGPGPGPDGDPFDRPIDRTPGPGVKSPNPSLPTGPGVFDPTHFQPVGGDKLSRNITRTLEDLLEGGGFPTQGLGQDLVATIRGQLARGGQPRAGSADADLAEATRAMIARGGRAEEGSIGADLVADVRGLLERGGQLDEPSLALRFETAREQMDQARQALLNQSRADLASRNLLSVPGIRQGPEIQSVERIAGEVAQPFAQAIRQNVVAEQERADARHVEALAAAGGISGREAQRLADAYAASGGIAERSDRRIENSLSMAAGISQAQAANLLATIGVGTERQTALNDIALGILDRNMEWNQFLTEFGLQRAQVKAMIEQNDMNSLLSLIQSFLNITTIGRSGQVEGG